jgi:hypothetical protein
LQAERAILKKDAWIPQQHASAASVAGVGSWRSRAVAMTSGAAVRPALRLTLLSQWRPK